MPVCSEYGKVFDALLQLMHLGRFQPAIKFYDVSSSFIYKWGSDARNALLGVPRAYTTLVCYVDVWVTSPSCEVTRPTFQIDATEGERMFTLHNAHWWHEKTVYNGESFFVFMKPASMDLFLLEIFETVMTK